MIAAAQLAHIGYHRTAAGFDLETAVEIPANGTVHRGCFVPEPEVVLPSKGG